MNFYIEGTLKQLSLVKRTFQLSPKKEYMQEKDGKKYLVCVENKEKSKSTDSSAPNDGSSERLDAKLLGEHCMFKFGSASMQLVSIMNSKSAVGIEINDPEKSDQPITVSDVIVL